MPWLYEMGVEVYKVAKRGSSIELQEAAQEFRQAVNFAVHGPLSHEFLGSSKDMFMIIEEIEPILDRALIMLDIKDHNPGRRRTRPGSDVDA